jgi:hypothetical protein
MVNEPLGDLERSAIHPDVFTYAKDSGIALHLFPDAFADCFEICNSGHSIPVLDSRKIKPEEDYEGS